MNEKLRDYFLSRNFSFCLIFAKDNIIADDRITNIKLKILKLAFYRLQKSTF
jgi:hypothetical protein